MDSRMKIGLCTIIAVEEMQVITYALVDFHTALLQAWELQRGVKAKIEEYPSKTNSGLKQITFKIPQLKELIIVQEIEVGDKVLEVEL